MIEINRAGTALEEALRLQFQNFSENERASRIKQLLDSAENQIVSLDDCLICRRGERLDGVLLLVSQTDGTVYVWPAETRGVLHPDDDSQIRRLLYEEAARVVDSPGVWIGQSLLETDQKEQSREFSEHGFPRLTDLIFMNYAVRSTTALSSRKATSADEFWSSEPFDEETNAADFARLVEQTYLETCDCPELNGTRDGWESMESHRRAGTYCPSRWRLFRHEGRPAGLLLLTEHSPEPVWEVVYFGVAPEFRGMGFGKRILAAGIDLAQEHGVDEIVLAVDVRNEPATRLYQQLKFAQFDRRIVHARLRKSRTSELLTAVTQAAKPNR
ncbi:MAG: GNAT family N-acetyltransferase [Planctomycetota bacterium]|nr:GNAT family N-acetyltransferase [Planctomycetota bacterium]